MPRRESESIHSSSDESLYAEKAYTQEEYEAIIGTAVTQVVTTAQDTVSKKKSTLAKEDLIPKNRNQ